MYKHYTKSTILQAAKNGNVYVDTPCFTKKGVFRMLKSNVSFELSNGNILYIHSGMYWDENSIPYVLQWAFPKSGMYAVPALIHDALYFDTSTTQDFADKEFVYWMKALELSKRQILFRYWAVRTFGGRWWRKNKNNPSHRCLANRKLIKVKMP